MLRLVHLPLDDLLRAGRKLALVDGSRVLPGPRHVLHHFEVIGVIGEHHERLPLRLHGNFAIGSLVESTLVGDCCHVKLHAALRRTVNGSVDIAVEREVVGAAAEFPLREYALEQHFLDVLGHFRDIDGHLGDLSRDVLLFVGEEIVRIALTRHVVFTHQAIERRLQTFAQGNLVHAHVVDHKRGDVVQRALEVRDVADKVEQLQHADILGPQHLMRLGSTRSAVNHLQDAVLQIL